MRYKKVYERAVVEVPETRLDLPVCEICNKRLAGYQIDKGGGKFLKVCKRCLLIELTE